VSTLWQSARWKKLLLLALLAVGVLAALRFALPLRAENAAPANTPEQITRAFLALLKPQAGYEISRTFNPAANTLTDDDDFGNEQNAARSRGLEPALKSILARKTFNQLGEDGTEKLFREIADTPPPLQWEVIGGQGASNTNAQTAIVQVSPQSNAAFPVICILENNAWRVDLVETFGKWFGLSRTQKEARIFALTGISAADLSGEENGGRTLCQRNLKQLALGMQQYLQDYDELYPPARQWCDGLAPYLKNEEVFHCPATNHQHGYAMNWRMSVKNESMMNEAARDVLIYESLTQRRNHSGEGKGLAFRHAGGTNMAFADGHVKWFAQNTQQKWPDVLFIVR
jgi:prepilin-type processing-associated H-X9-DG protein